MIMWHAELCCNFRNGCVAQTWHFTQAQAAAWWITALRTVAHDNEEKQNSLRSTHSGRLPHKYTPTTTPQGMWRRTVATQSKSEYCFLFFYSYFSLYVCVWQADLREWRKEKERKRDWTICVHISPPSSHQGHCMLLLMLPSSWRLALVALGTIGIAGDESCLSHMRLNWPLTLAWLDQQYQIT